MKAGPLIVATRSADKLREIRDILARVSRAEIISLVDAGIEPAAEEDGIEVFDTFLGNAHAKADYFMKLSGHTVIADDSGICVDALDGAPGVHSRRFADVAGLAGLDQDRANNEKLLRLLEKVPDDHRGAHYACAAVLHTPAGRRVSAMGTCSGRILRAPRGSGGFGYDPLFLHVEMGLSFGEMDPERKNRLSHRARAFHALAGAL